MAQIVGVQFKNMGKVYSFDAMEKFYKKGDSVVVETARGIEVGSVIYGNRETDLSDLQSPLKPILRLATAEDTRKAEENRAREAEAMRICQQKIADHNLEMKLVDVEYTLDGSKILFYFTADGRVDFRELVKDLASAFHTRIELRQIGVRDEAKHLGGLGICGQPFCCARFLSDFQPVSIKMAKEQGLSPNPAKISGSCGRLLCCLKYEQDAYDFLRHEMPRPGTQVSTAEGKGVITDVSLLTGKLKVRLQKSPDAPPVSMKLADVTVLNRDGAPVIREPEKEETPFSLDDVVTEADAFFAGGEDYSSDIPDVAFAAVDNAEDSAEAKPFADETRTSDGENRQKQGGRPPHRGGRRRHHRGGGKKNHGEHKE